VPWLSTTVPDELAWLEDGLGSGRVTSQSSTDVALRQITLSDVCSGKRHLVYPAVRPSPTSFGPYDGNPVPALTIRFCVRTTANWEAPSPTWQTDGRERSLLVIFDEYRMFA